MQCRVREEEKRVEGSETGRQTEAETVGGRKWHAEKEITDEKMHDGGRSRPVDTKAGFPLSYLACVTRPASLPKISVC